MKKFLLGSIAFFLFSISVSILQTSCDKDAAADPNKTNGVNQVNKIVYMIRPDLESKYEIWTANYDGTNQTRVNLSMPSGFVPFPYSDGPRVSPDGKKMFFTGAQKTPHRVYFFSSNIDGSNVIPLFDVGTETGSHGRLGDAF